MDSESVHGPVGPMAWARTAWLCCWVVKSGDVIDVDDNVCGDDWEACVWGVVDGSSKFTVEHVEGAMSVRLPITEDCGLVSGNDADPETLPKWFTWAAGSWE